ncbi:hypothetical protein N7519_009124 [Penicillium mononematosum]|uniref:uncharacterized protein n=1 Tax=Penicillium mononematosum TaxID=268346 RepID=UPI002546A045|nr:uncharacterized protein N7519_009124 [Penicillium mononematosum]KAJ6178663.1 hypothetical protein N7519_009124 [Penicillium mononematosum]
MPTPEPDSHVDQPTKSDFRVPDEAERLTRPTKRQTLREIRRIASKLDTHPETTQYLLIIDVSDDLRDYLLNDKIGGARLTVDDHDILLRIMPSRQHGSVVADFAIFFGAAMTRASLPHGVAGKRLALHSARGSAAESNRILPYWVDVELWSAPGGTRPGLPISQSATPGPDHPKLFKPRTEIKITQALRVTGGAVTLVKGPGLDINLDYELLMREDRPTGQADIVITQQMLQRICEEVQ